MEVTVKKRPYHVLSGRLRTELYDLKNNPETASRFEQVFSSIKGILSIETNIISGKVLLYYDEKMLTLEELCTHIFQFEEQLLQRIYKEEAEYEAGNFAVYSEAAATYDVSAEKTESGAASKIVESFLKYLPKNFWARAPAEEKVPLPLALSVAGIAVLGIKQLFFGGSLIARHPVPFSAAAAFSICTGYSFIKERLHNFGKNRWVNIDLLISASALILALMRENIIVLAGLSLIQYLNWKREEAKENDLMDQEFVSEEIEAYSRRAGKLGFLGAAAALAVTRNPLVPLGILLAANPRPITVSAEYAWKQAEHAARENKQTIPMNGSVHQLTQTKYIVFEDASILTADGRSIRNECIPLLTPLQGGKAAIVNNERKADLQALEKEMEEYGVELTSHQDLNVIKREEVLVVLKDQVVDKNKVISFYPCCTIGELSGITSTLQKSHHVKKLVKRNLWITRIWNIAGSLLAIPMLMSPPLTNLIGDTLSLLFMSGAKNSTERWFAASQPNESSAAMDHKVPWHSLSSVEILRYFKMDLHDGLSREQIKQALSLYGNNQLAAKVRSHWAKAYLGQFKEFATQVLGATAILSMMTGHLFDGIIMGAILLINAGISTIQERKADQAVEKMNEFVPPKCRVIREGTQQEIAARDLVPGDIVELEAGDCIPADLRILRAWNLEANEAALTGESLSVEKTETVLEESTPINDRTNMLYMGTHITKGKCIAVVAQTGKNTEMGHLLTLLSSDEDQTTPLQKQVTAISKKFVKGAFVVGTVVFLTGLIRGIPLTEMITTSVALTASAIPEGLPITITFALTAGIFRMARKKALVRKLSALETLGRTTVICLDKTGTLTKNEMTVKRISTINLELEVTGDGYQPEGVIKAQNAGRAVSKEIEQLLKIALHCNDAQFYQEDGRWKVKGDPTEGALLTLAAKAGLHKEDHSHWKRAGEIPFDSANGKMTVVCHEDEQKEQCYCFSKGSVEKLLKHCTSYQKDGGIYPLTDNIRNQIMHQNDSLAGQALRVLGFAFRELGEFSGNMSDAENNLVFVGMVGMIDPPKPEVEKSICEAMGLGIQPVIVTGDHPLTALALARQIGIINGEKKVITGQELDLFSDQELEAIIDNIVIFARVTPEHKLRIVAALQEKGHVVTMTGDGVNDSPAIKKADVGIAMGQTGTQVTKETADMVLKEDHFGSIVDGVKEGRTIIGNIRKALGCLLSGNLSEILVSSVAVMAGMPLPVVPVQILLMNLLTDALPAMILAVNPGKKKKETQRQEIVDNALYKQVITRGVILGMGSLGLFIWSLRAGMTLAAAQTTAFAALVAGQLMQTFSWRQAGSGESFKDLKNDRFLVGALGLSWISLFSVIYIPPIAGIFKTVALPLWNWGPILLVSIAAAKLAKPLSKYWISALPANQMPEASAA